jgi:A/G-specific adenine glycosylase
VRGINEATARLLLAWYSKNRRDLPWRREPSAYHTWISEIMLQQTRVEAVKDYYRRFISALPSIEALAAVEDDRLLKLWEGLGYYSRARNLKKAAQLLLREFGGTLPRSVEELLRLPGIGLYTAGAIASIAYGVAAPAVDGNVLRVIMRLEGRFDDVAREQVKKETALRLLQTMPQGCPGAFNQALMELGALICLPNGAPKCDACPLAGDCAANEQKLQALLPVKSPKKPRRVEERCVLLCWYEDRVALRRRPCKGLLAGLWELPNALGGWEALAAQLSIAPESIASASPGKCAKHIFTHIEWHMRGMELRLLQPPSGGALVWVTLRELREAYALPSAFAAFRGALLEREACAPPARVVGSGLRGERLK